MTVQARSNLIMMRIITAILFLIYPACLNAVVGSSKPVLKPSMQISHTVGAINIDGQMGDSGWANATHITNFVERSPGDNTPPEIATEVYVTYDDSKLYIAFVCHDNPLSIRATMTQRDQYTTDDAVTVMLDTYGDAAWAYELSVNPYGIQKDQLWTPFNVDLGFDLIWESAARVTDSGYTVEMAVPFASLRFPDRPEQKWRLDFQRTRSRETLQTYSWAADDRNEQCFPCKFGSVDGIRNVHPGRGLEILPSLVAHQTGAVVNQSDPNASFHNDNPRAELSLGTKYSITSDMTAEATFNPDFSQIEADATQISVNSTTSLFYPERRPFFQEGSDIFQTLFNSFYSRTINHPEFAAKFTNRQGKTRLGVLTAYDSESPYIIPLNSSNYTLDVGKSYVTVARGSHDIGLNNQLGLILSDRRFDGGGYGSILSADGRLRLSKTYNLTVQYIYTLTKEPKIASFVSDSTFDAGKHTVALDGESYGGHAFVEAFNRTARHWNSYLGYNQIAPTYRTQVGFDPVNNHRTVDLTNNYTLYPKSGPVVQWIPIVYISRRWDYLTGVRRYDYDRAELQAQTKWAQTLFDASYHHDYEKWQNVPFGALDWYNFNFASKFSNRLGGGGYFTGGWGIERFAIARGRMFDYGFNLAIKPVDRLTIEPQIDYARMTDPAGGGRYFAGYIMHTRFQYQGTAALSLRLVLQYDDFQKLWNVDPLLTYRLNPFSVFYLGAAVDYGQIYSDPSLPPIISRWRNTNHQLFMKLQYLFRT